MAPTKENWHHVLRAAASSPHTRLPGERGLELGAMGQMCRGRGLQTNEGPRGQHLAQYKILLGPQQLVLYLNIVFPGSSRAASTLTTNERPGHTAAFVVMVLIQDHPNI